MSKSRLDEISYAIGELSSDVKNGNKRAEQFEKTVLKYIETTNARIAHLEKKIDRSEAFMAGVMFIASGIGAIVAVYMPKVLTKFF